MITIQEATAMQRAEILKIRSDLESGTWDIRPETNCMAVVEDARILGFGFFDRNVPNCRIFEVFILPEYRRMSFGDGLLRAMMNSQERGGSETVFVAANEVLIPFLKREELIESAEQIEWNSTVKNIVWFEANLKDFFGKPCRGGK